MPAAVKPATFVNYPTIAFTRVYFNLIAISTADSTDIVVLSCPKR